MVTHPNTEPPKVPKASKIHTQLVASLVNGEVFPIQITEKKSKNKTTPPRDFSLASRNNLPKVFSVSQRRGREDFRIRISYLM